jgi:hypothetical protein
MRIQQYSFQSLLLATVLASVIPIQESMGQAYCALRDPVRVLYEAYPDADGHRSIIRTVTVEDRAAIAKVLPFTIHFDELGRHTLYITVREGKPLGVLHVRSERGPFGLTEIAWSLDLDGRITDVAFQRCRDTLLRTALNDQLRAQMVGADVPMLLRLLDDEGLSDESRLLLQSAAKTAAVTAIVWEADLLPTRAAAKAAIAWPEFDPILTLQPLDRSNLSSDAGLDIKSIHVWTMTRVDGEELGTLVRSLWKLDGLRAELWWRMDRGGRIVDVEILNGDNPSIVDAFREVIGLDVSNADQCATAAGVATGEVLRAINVNPRVEVTP